MTQPINLKKSIPYYKEILAIIITIVITMFLGYSMQIQPLQIQLQNNLNQQTTIKLQIQKTQQQIKKLQSWQKQWKILEKNYLLPKSTEQLTTATALKNIAMAIASSQITTISILPQTNTNKANITNSQFTPQLFELNAIGNFRQIINFFLAVKNLNLLTSISAFTIKQTNNVNNDNYDNNILILNISLQIFAFDHKKHRDKITITRDPFGANISTTSLPLTSWENKDLQFLGKIQQDNKSWGIISDPSGQIHYVMVGTLIGTNNNKISKITDNAIITENNIDNIYR